MYSLKMNKFMLVKFFYYFNIIIIIITNSTLSDITYDTVIYISYMLVKFMPLDCHMLIWYVLSKGICMYMYI